MKFFEFLDQKGGFYYEVRTSGSHYLRPPSHAYSFDSAGATHQYTVSPPRSSPRRSRSISSTRSVRSTPPADQASSLTLATGYRHNPFQHCPQGDAHKQGKCWCNPKDNFDYEWYSCLARYDKLFK